MNDLRFRDYTRVTQGMDEAIHACRVCGARYYSKEAAWECSILHPDEFTTPTTQPTTLKYWCVIYQYGKRVSIDVESSLTKPVHSDAHVQGPFETYDGARGYADARERKLNS